MSTITATERLAVFDLDRTLIDGSSLVPLARQLARRGIVDRAQLIGAMARNTRFRRSGADASAAAHVAELALQAVAGAPARAVREATFDAAVDIVRSIRPAVRQLVLAHAARGDLCAVVSAAPHELVGDIARLADLDLGIGTEVEVVDGRLTGRLAGPLCQGAAKVARIRQELPHHPLERATGYTDGIADLPLLEACGIRVAVHPDRPLRRVATREGWRIVS